MSDLDDLTGVVRLFPDDAGSPLWFADRIPLGYVDSEITAELATRLTRWEQSYYNGLDPTSYNWRTPELKRAFEAEGSKLAQALADEIGGEFRVQFITDTKEIFHSTTPATNPAAAAAFRAFQRDAQEQEDQRGQLRERLHADGKSLGWTAYAPMSGTGMPIDPLRDDGPF